MAAPGAKPKKKISYNIKLEKAREMLTEAQKALLEKQPDAVRFSKLSSVTSGIPPPLQYERGIISQTKAQKGKAYDIVRANVERERRQQKRKKNLDLRDNHNFLKEIAWRVV